MGSSLSGILATAFVDSIEKRALRSFDNINIFKRYVDDCFLLAHNSQQAKCFLQHLNAQHSGIKFEIEHPRNAKTLSLLDFSVTIDFDNGHKFEFYKKTAQKIS